MATLPKGPLLPLAKVLRDARKAAGLSQEDYAYEITHRGKKKLSGGAVSQIERGVFQATVDTIEAIAKTASVPVETVAEYQLALARRELDEKVVGLDAALTRLLDMHRATPVGRPTPGDVAAVAKAEVPRSQARRSSNPKAPKTTRRKGQAS